MQPASETGPSQESIIADLVRKAIEGDVEAYGRLYSMCLDRIYRYVLNRVKNVMLAEDITEEVFVKAWNAIKSLKGKEQAFIPWLYRIAHNHMVDFFRKNHREVNVDDLITLSDDSDPEKAAEDNLEVQKILEAIKNLPKQQRQVILLKFRDEIDNSEIGRLLGKRQGAVRVLQMRALVTLRQQFASEVE